MTLIAGRYELESVLGKGDYGTTHLGRDLHRPSQPYYCVIKALHSSHPAIVRRFQQEAKILEKLGHYPQVPQLFAYFAEGYRFYIVQEYIEGHDLSHEIQSGKKLSEGYALKLLQEVLTVLDIVHRQGVIHRDIKPQNLVRRRTDGTVFLIDFGIIKELSNSEAGRFGRIKTTVVAGTEEYMPDEQKRGKPQLSSDLYALGLVAIEALTGIIPHRLRTHSDTREWVWREEATVSDDLATFLEHLTYRHPSRRPRSAQQALQRLSALSDSAEHAPTHVVAPAAESRQTTLPFAPPPTPLPYKAISIAVGTGLALLVGWGLGLKAMNAWQYWRQAAALEQRERQYPEAADRELVCLYEDCDRDLRLQPAAGQAFWQLWAAAQEDDVDIYPLAGFQSLAAQQQQLADLSAAKPERYWQHTDYQTGYVLALGDSQAPDTDWQREFEKTEAFAWLQQNAADFGFELSFPKGNAKRIDYEPWRWRYVGDAESRRVFEQR